MTLMYALLWLLAAHFVADFVLQSNWMAQNKSKSNYALGAHVGVYTVVMAVAGFLVIGRLDLMNFEMYVAWVALNGALHFATDFVTSRINAKLYATKRIHGFFVGIGADQLIHAWTLALTLDWLVYR
jgi:hypothetical protein